MRKYLQSKARWIIPLLAGSAALLTGCGTSLSKGIRDDGSAAEVVFPEISSSWKKDGDFPNLDNLRTVRSGITKSQLYTLLGEPHFREGIGEVREWDYLFQMPIGSPVTTCQYKVIFDKLSHGRSFYWKPGACAALMSEPAATPARVSISLPPSPPPAVPAAVPQPPRIFSLRAEGLFRIGGATKQDLLLEGRQRIAELAGEIRHEFKSLDRFS